MKKIILALGVAAAVCGMTACNGGANSQSAEDKAMTDSLGNAFGTFLGKQMEMQISQFKMQLGDKFNEADFKRGIEAGMKLDSANVSYLLGMSLGQQALFQVYQWNQSDIKVNPEVISKALVKSIGDTTVNGQDAYMQFQLLNNRVQEKIQEKEQAAKAAEAEKNIEAGKKYVADLQSKDADIKSTESGLAYKISQPGEGPKVSEGSNVKVIYTGKHINGEEFDSSKGEPVEFNIAGVVPGFAEGLMLLGKGGKATLYIPGDLAYGAQGQPRAGIQPNEMLVFDVEVVDFTPAE